MNEDEITEYLEKKIMNYDSILEVNRNPVMTLRKYIERIMKHVEKFIEIDKEKMLALVVKYIERAKIIINKKNIYLLTLIAIMITYKYIEDIIYITNYEFSIIGKMNLKDLNKAEIIFLKKIDYRLF